MIEPFLWILWGMWIAQALLSALNLVGFERNRRKQDRRFQDIGAAKERPTALIVSIKGFDKSLTPKFFEAVLTQEYTKYRAIITMESSDEPIVSWLRDELGMEADETTWRPSKPGKGLQEIVIVFAGRASDMGQKVHNQIEAFKHLTDEDEIIAFADADIACNSNWLSRLLAPINIGEFQLSTTYRWLVPKKHTLANVFASVINSSVATMSGRGVAMTWGGSMALTRKAYEALNLPELFSGCLNDDLRLGRAARRNGFKIASIRSLITPSPINYSWFGFFEFARRQYYQVKHFTPILFMVALILTGLYTAGFITAVVAVWQEYFYAWIPIACVTLFDQLRALGRARVIRNLYDAKTAAILDDTSVVEHWFTPVWMLIHFCTVILALFARTITWAGITYQVKAPNRTIILNRRDNPEPTLDSKAKEVPPEELEPEERTGLPEVINSKEGNADETSITGGPGLPTTEDSVEETEISLTGDSESPASGEQSNRNETDQDGVQESDIPESESDDALPEEVASPDSAKDSEPELSEKVLEVANADTVSDTETGIGAPSEPEAETNRKRTGFPFSDEGLLDDVDLSSTTPISSGEHPIQSTKEEEQQSPSNNGDAEAAAVRRPITAPYSLTKPPTGNLGPKHSTRSNSAIKSLKRKLLLITGLRPDERRRIEREIRKRGKSGRNKFR